MTVDTQEDETETWLSALRSPRLSAVTSSLSNSPPSGDPVTTPHSQVSDIVMDATPSTPPLTAKPVVPMTRVAKSNHSWIVKAISVLLLLGSTLLNVISMSLSDWRSSGRVLQILSLAAGFVLLAWTLAVIVTSRLGDQSSLKRQLHWLGRTILPVVGALGSFLGFISVVLWASSDDKIATSFRLLLGATILLAFGTVLVRYNVPMREPPHAPEDISPRPTEPLV